jgi:hypothetical protein
MKNQDSEMEVESWLAAIYASLNPMPGGRPLIYVRLEQAKKRPRPILFIAGDELWKPPQTETMESVDHHFCHNFLRHLWLGPVGGER